MRQHPIPQNIMDVEFKLVGDLTLRQFAYVAVGAGLGYLAFISGLPRIIKWPLTALFGFSGVAFSFLPISSRSLDVWLLNYFQAIYKPQRRIWNKKSNLPDYLTMKVKHLKKRGGGSRYGDSDADERLTAYLAQHQNQNENNPAELLERKLLTRVNSLVNEEMKSKQKPNTSIVSSSNTRLPPIKNRVVEKAPKKYAGRINYAEGPVIPVKITGKEKYYKTPLTNTTPNRALRLDRATQQASTALSQKGKPKPVRQHLQKIVSSPQEVLTTELPESVESANQRNEILLTEVKNVLTTLKEYNASGPQPIIDPKAFPNLRGDSITKKLIDQKAKKQKKKEPAINKKGTPLTSNVLIDSLSTQAPTPPPSVEEQRQTEVETLKKQNEQILKQLKNTQKSLIQIAKPPKAPAATAPSPEKTEESFVPSNRIVPQPLEVEDLTKKLINEKKKQTAKISRKSNQAAPANGIQNLTQQPNILNGIVYDRNGKLVGNAIILVKDDAGIPKWASKTNNVGQFIMSTALNRGTYTIEVQKPGESFKPISLTITDGIIKPILIRGT